MNEIAASRGGKCLSDHYTNCRTKLKWQCGEGHEWDTKPVIVAGGSWCPHCRKSIGEHKCRFIFEKLFGVEFNTTRKVLPNRWELDGYNDHLKLAFEYNGEQHYEQIVSWHRDNKTLIRRQRVDEEKKKICEDKGIKLVTIPFIKSKDDNLLLSFIKQKLLEIGAIPTNDIQNLNDFGGYLRNRTGIENLIRQRGGTLLSSSHVDGSIRLQIQCEFGHEWNANYYGVRKGTWCPVCSHKKTAEQQTKHTVDSLNLLLEARHIKCIGEGKISTNQRADFCCDKGHIWNAQVRPVYYGSGCPYCYRLDARKRTITITECREKAASRSGRCLSETYDTYGNMLWECEMGHQWQARYSRIKHGSWCSKCADKRRRIEGI